MADLDGNGINELVVTLSFQRRGQLVASQEIRCYSQTAQLLWTHRFNHHVEYQGQDYGGPWRATDWLIVPDASGQSRVWVASGVNNEYRSSILVGIDPNGPPTVSPQSDTKYVCESCRAVPPQLYYLLPQTEAGRHSQPYPLGRIIQASATDVRVSSLESHEPVAYRHFQFGPSLDYRGAYVSDAYWTIHDRLEAEGKIDHPADRCPDRQPPSIRSWFDGEWRTLSAGSASR